MDSWLDNGVVLNVHRTRGSASPLALSLNRFKRGLSEVSASLSAGRSKLEPQPGEVHSDCP